MSEPFVGEIRMFAGNFAPRGWALAEGQLLTVSQNQSLFSLYGTTYGGDGRTTYGLPDLRGRIPIHEGTGPGLSNRRLGSKAGAESVTLTTKQTPNHTHTMHASGTDGTETLPTNNFYAPLVFTGVTAINKAYETSSDANMNASMLTSVGGSRSHTNLMPTLCINFIVALVGVFPSRN